VIEERNMASLIPKMTISAAVDSAVTGLPLDLSGHIAATGPDRDDRANGPRSARTGSAGRDEGMQLRRRLAGLDVVAIAAVWTPKAVLVARQAPVRQTVSCVVAAVVTLFAVRAAGLYQARVCAMRSAEVVRTLVAAGAGAAVYAGLIWLTDGGGVGSAFIMALPVAAAVLLLRWCFARWLKVRRGEGAFLRTIVLVGTNDEAVNLWTTLSAEPELGYRIGGVVGASRDDAPWHRLPTSTSTAELASVAEAAGANGAILVASALGDEGSGVVRQALAAGLHVQVWPGLTGVTSRRLRMTAVSGVPLLYVEPHRPLPWQVLFKRGMDVALAGLGCVVAAPLILAAAILIKASDGGPVFYRSSRVGRYGRIISVVKLRTMVVGASEMTGVMVGLNERTGPLFKVTKDPRETRVGRLLRATSIDELPQLWNVLNGTMSLVGPRPALPTEVEQFDDELRRRHEMRPGITGLWQIEARDNPSFSAYRRLDLAYLDSWSLGLDLAILGTTVHAVIARAIRLVARREG
jgi:exopolysaccharide biosynthesis polyprenyl glycosylphosphotransferase